MDNNEISDRARWELELSSLTGLLGTGDDTELLRRLELLSESGNPYAMYNLGIRVYRSDRDRAFLLFSNGDYVGSYECSRALTRMLWDRGEYEAAIERHLFCISREHEYVNTHIRSRRHLVSYDDDERDFQIFLDIVNGKTDDACAMCVAGSVYASCDFWGRPAVFSRDMLNGRSFYEKAYELGSSVAAEMLERFDEDGLYFGNVTYTFDDFFDNPGTSGSILRFGGLDEYKHPFDAA